MADSYLTAFAAVLEKLVCNKLFFLGIKTHALIVLCSWVSQLCVHSGHHMHSLPMKSLKYIVVSVRTVKSCFHLKITFSWRKKLGITCAQSLNASNRRQRKSTSPFKKKKHSIFNFVLISSKRTQRVSQLLQVSHVADSAHCKGCISPKFNKQSIFSCYF